MIKYTDSADSLSVQQLPPGFFQGWPNPPSRETHLRLLRESDAVVLALEAGSGAVVGFITGISDGVLAAYIPLLEVLPAYRGRGIGKELVRRMLDRLGHLYMVDLLCLPDLQPFYRSLGMQRRTFDGSATVPGEAALRSGLGDGKLQDSRGPVSQSNAFGALP